MSASRTGVWSVVLAAGSGVRFGAAKQFEQLGDVRVVDWSVRALAPHSDGLIVVVPDGVDPSVLDRTTAHGIAPVVVVGGASRSESVRRALAHVPAEATVVLVHDAARPFVPESVVAGVLRAVANGADGAVPGLPVADTIKVVSDTGAVETTPERSRLRAVQTPQAFRAEALRRAHSMGADATDDAALVERGGGKVVVVEGDPILRKITTREDLEWARVAAQHQSEPEI